MERDSSLACFIPVFTVWNITAVRFNYLSHNLDNFTFFRIWSYFIAITNTVTSINSHYLFLSTDNLHWEKYMENSKIGACGFRCFMLTLPLSLFMLSEFIWGLWPPGSRLCLKSRGRRSNSSVGLATLLPGRGERHSTAGEHQCSPWLLCTRHPGAQKSLPATGKRGGELRNSEHFALDTGFVGGYNIRK